MHLRYSNSLKMLFTLQQQSHALLECLFCNVLLCYKSSIVDTGLQELYLPLLVTGIHCTMGWVWKDMLCQSIFLKVLVSVRWSWDKPYCPGCKHWCPSYVAIWLRASLCWRCAFQNIVMKWQGFCCGLEHTVSAVWLSKEVELIPEPRDPPTVLLAMHCARSRTDLNCPCAVRCERPLITSCPIPRRETNTLRERKLWWKKFKIKSYASGFGKIWDSRSIEWKEKLSTDPLTAVLVSLDHFYGICGVSSWNGRLQTSQPSLISYWGS